MTALGLISSGVVAVSALAYAVLTWRLTKETVAMREAQTDPHLGVSVEPRAEYINLVEMVVENYGPGPARDVTFTPDGDFVLDKKSGSRLSDTHLFRRGIAYLVPQQHLRFLVANLVEDRDLLDAEPMRLQIRYENSRGKFRMAECYLDLRYLKGLEQLGTPDSHKLARAAEKMAREVSHLTSGFHQCTSSPRPRRTRRASRRRDSKGGDRKNIFPVTMVASTGNPSEDFPAPRRPLFPPTCRGQIQGARLPEPLVARVMTLTKRPHVARD